MPPGLAGLARPVSWAAEVTGTEEITPERSGGPGRCSQHALVIGPGEVLVVMLTTDLAPVKCREI